MQPGTTTRTALLAVFGVTLCACLNAACLLWLVIARPALNTDFRGLWSFARFARCHAAQIYQAAPLLAFQRQIYPGFGSFFPYQYPPSFLAAIRWLGDFDYARAELLWTLAGMLALSLSAAMFFTPGRRGFAIAALLASPASLLNGAAGETGYFTTALLLAGFALLPARPWAAGVAFGLLSLKPQLGLLVPVVLLARRDYRAFAAACGTVLALMLLSCLMFPAALWLDWLRGLAHYQAQYMAARALDLNNAVTVAGNLSALGAPARLAWSIQALASACSAAAVFWVARYRCERLPAAVFSGMFLCAPHAYAYDTLPLVAAMLLHSAAPALCLVTYLAPYLLLLGPKSWFLYTVPETLMFASIIMLAIGRKPRPDTGYEPVSAAESRGQF